VGGGSTERIRFGDFELDPRAGELLRGKARIRLQEQPLQILLMLLDKPGELVTREEIRNRLWPNDTVVEFDHSIGTAIKKLRQALDDEAGSHATWKPCLAVASASWFLWSSRQPWWRRRRRRRLRRNRMPL